MNEAVLTGGVGLNSTADAALKAAGRFWFAVAVTGQWMFVYYIVAHYGGALTQLDAAAFDMMRAHGFVAGDTLGDIAIAGHLFLAAVITFGGPLQLMPQVRSRFPTFHRWNGRLYIVTAFTMSVSGVFMVWKKGAVGDTAQHIAISLNAMLIVLCAVMALRHAMARDFTTHRRWALRLFLVVSGVWFFRVGMMLWLVANKGPAGFDPQTFTGPFLIFLTYAQYLLPLAVLEMYFRAQRGRDAAIRLATAAGIAVLTVAMGIGIVAATMGMWLPRISGG